MKSEASTEPRIADAAFVAGATSAAGLPAPTLAEIAFCGRSNVGKSSLLNAMMQRREPRAHEPHARLHAADQRLRGARPPAMAARRPLRRPPRLRLREALEEPRRRSGGRCSRATSRSGDPARGGAPRRRAARPRRRRPRARRVLACAGEGGAPEPLDVVVVATKLDKLPLSQRKPALEVVRKNAGPGIEGIVGFSAVNGEGRDALWKRIRHAVL